jgi:hypothetical protein
VKVEAVLNHQIDGTLVDGVDHSFVDGIEGFRANERAARWSRYGKLNQGLYDRLQAMDLDDRVAFLIRSSARP